MRPATIVAAALAIMLALLAVQGAGAGAYIGGGTVVYKEQPQSGQEPAAEVDRGVLVCEPESGVGVGGGCIPFSAGVSAIMVQDVVQQTTVAFQVCIDINGDGRCVSQGPVTDFSSETVGKLCQQGLDLVWFSHDDRGNFFNPLGPLPNTMPPMCPGHQTGFQGYVVFLCEGVHDTVVDGRHAHPSTTGTITGVPQGTGYGDFCGGLRDQVVKQYVLA